MQMYRVRISKGNTSVTNVTDEVSIINLVNAGYTVEIISKEDEK